MLKQPQYSPVPVEQQVAIIYASTNGLLDKVPVDKVKEFESEFNMLLSSQYADALTDLRKGNLSDTATTAIRKVVADLTARY
jgi:F-type H+-transporting ATPase subunit alpha